MLLRALMLNPTRSKATPVQGVYSASSVLYDVAYDAVAKRITYTPRKTGVTPYALPVLPASNRLVTLRDGTVFRRYQVTAKGLKVAPFDTLTVPAAPATGYSAIGMFGTADFIFQGSGASGQNNFYARNALTGAVAGPYAMGGGANLTTGDRFVRPVAIPEPVTLTQKTAGTGSQTVTYVEVAPAANEGATAFLTLDSTGLVGLPVLGLPFRWTGTGTSVLVRTFGMALQPAIQWHSPGSLRMPASLTLTEVYDDGETGRTMTLANGSVVPTRTFRMTRRSVYGVLQVSAGAAAFETHVLTESSDAGAFEVGVYGPNRYVAKTPKAVGSWLTAPPADLNYTPLGLTAAGIVSRRTSGGGSSVWYSDSNGAVQKGSAPTDPSDAYVIPATGALVVKVADTFFVRGQAYVSLDLGATWSAVVTHYSSSTVGTAPAIVANASVPAPLVPLLP